MFSNFDSEDDDINDREGTIQSPNRVSFQDYPPPAEIFRMPSVVKPKKIMNLVNFFTKSSNTALIKANFMPLIFGFVPMNKISRQ
jgi:hypothetical protein